MYYLQEVEVRHHGDYDRDGITTKITTNVTPPAKFDLIETMVNELNLRVSNAMLRHVVDGYGVTYHSDIFDNSYTLDVKAVTDKKGALKQFGGESNRGTSIAIAMQSAANPDKAIYIRWDVFEVK